jgi:hypothetical protein
MRTHKFYRGLFWVAAAYDLLLGVVFFFFYKQVYAYLGIAPPTDPAYLELSTAFVFVQGVGYWLVYRNLERNVDIVKVGIVYKLAYAGVALCHYFAGDLPHDLFAVFGVLDLVFVVLFAMFVKDHRTLGARSA